MAKRADWTPFKPDGTLNLVLSTDPWWCRLWARLRGEPIWHRLGAITEDGVQ